MSRASCERQRAALKTATFAAVRAAGGGEAIAAAGLTRVNPPMLSLYAAPHESERFAGLDVALDLDLVAGRPIIARQLASLQGFDLTRRTALPQTTAAGPSMADALILIREARDVEISVLAGLADGILTANEKRVVKTEIAELRAVLNSIEAKVDAA